VLPNAKERIFASGMDDHLSKPVIMSELRAALQKAEVADFA
jgi:CheY-like chemotaxis protein